MDKQTRLFFMVDGSITNEEIFETLEQAQGFYKETKKSEIDGERNEWIRLSVAMVKNAYQEEDFGRLCGWSYEDNADTFEIVKTLKEERL